MGPGSAVSADVGTGVRESARLSLPLPFPQLHGGLLALPWGCSVRGDHVLEEDHRLRSCGPCWGTKAVSGRAGLLETPGFPQAWLLPATHPGPSSLDRPSEILS